eukprot:349593-Chlamydomonas_euryale.AAC.5
MAVVLLRGARVLSKLLDGRKVSPRPSPLQLPRCRWIVLERVRMHVVQHARAVEVGRLRCGGRTEPRALASDGPPSSERAVRTAARTRPSFSAATRTAGALVTGGEVA